MSEHAPATSEPKAEFFDQSHAGKLTMILPAAGGLAILACIIGAFVNREQLAYSWLFAFAYFFTLVVGSLFWVLVHHATDAEWSVVVRRVLENLGGLIPVLVLFFIPVLCFAPILFKWWNIPPGTDELFDKKHAYLNHGFFILRSVLYFLLLSFVALRMRKNSTLQDADGHPKYTIVMRRLAFFGIPVLGLSVTFGAFDWLMGLDYKWFSTMWGVYIFAGAAGSGMCLLILVVTALRNQGYFKDVITMEHYHIMGKLMFAFCVFWAYIGFDQYMLTWYANIPEETSYFIRRNIGSWHTLSTFLVVFHFFVPFPILLQQTLKKSPRAICIAAGWLLLMQLLDMYIVVMPMLHSDGASPSILDLCALVAIGAPLAFVFIKTLGKSSLYPVRDPRLVQSLKLTN